MFAFFLSGAAALALGAPPAKTPELTKIVLLAPAEGAPKPLMTPPEMISPTPRGSLLSVFKAGDYPKEALDRKEGGIVQLSVHVDAAGRVDACAVTRSSGSSALDGATCRIISERALFKPARDEAGKAIGVDLEQGFLWQPSKAVPGEVPRLLSVVTPGRNDADGPVPTPLGADGKPSTIGLLSLFSSDDYPAEAMRKEETGTVAARISVDDKGKVTGCEVTETSKSPSLDAVTCSVFMERAKFRPALDAKGKAVAGSYTQRVRWMLPEAPPMPFANDSSRSILTFDAGGKVASCKHSKPVPADMSKAMCDQLAIRSAEMAQPDELASRTLVFDGGLRVGGPEVTQAIGRTAGQDLVRIDAYAIEVGPDGKVARCGPADGSRAYDGGPCDWLNKMTFEAPAQGAAPAVRRAVSYFAIYFEQGAK